MTRDVPNAALAGRRSAQATGAANPTGAWANRVARVRSARPIVMIDERLADAASDLARNVHVEGSPICSVPQAGRKQ